MASKYNFEGIKKHGAAQWRALLASSPYTAWTLGLGRFLDFFLEMLSNFLANKGLVVMNIGAVYVDGEIQEGNINQGQDKAQEDIKKIGRDNLTDAQKKAIDDAFKAKARKFIIIGKPGSK